MQVTAQKSHQMKSTGYLRGEKRVARVVAALDGDNAQTRLAATPMKRALLFSLFFKTALDRLR